MNNDAFVQLQLKIREEVFAYWSAQINALYEAAFKPTRPDITSRILDQQEEP